MTSYNLQRYAAEKEAETLAAALAPMVTEVEARGSDLVEIGNEWSRALFGGPFYRSPPRSPEFPATSLVFVQSRDGNTGASDPSTLGGGETDKHLIYEGLSRVAVDAVLAGAETIRGGDIVFSTWHPELVRLRESLGLRRHPIQIVATLRGLSFERPIYPPFFTSLISNSFGHSFPVTNSRSRDSSYAMPFRTSVFARSEGVRRPRRST